MTPPSAQRFLAAIQCTQAALGKAGAPAMLISGVAILARGVPRTTLDVDATVDGAGT